MIYFDNAATTTVDNEVIKSYSKAVVSYFGNTSSKHSLGQESEQMYLKAKKQIAKYLLPTKVSLEEIIITSGATESNNLAIKGYVKRYYKKGKHIITTKVEHPSVLETMKSLEAEGFEVTYLDVSKEGISLEDLSKALREDTILVSIMAVNNEVGAVYDIPSLAKLTKSKSNAVFHCDATQALLKVTQDLTDCDLISFSAHKLHGIKGSGLLVKRENIDLIPLFDGGGQEKGYRSGTCNLPATIALATTLRVASETLNERRNGATKIYNYLYDELSKIDEIEIVKPIDFSPFILNFVMKEHKASVVAEALSERGIMVSTKSACSSKKLGGSYVLRAYGYDDRLSGNGIRLSFCGNESMEDAKIFIVTLKEILNSTRKDNDGY